MHFSLFISRKNMLLWKNTNFGKKCLLLIMKRYKTIFLFRVSLASVITYVVTLFIISVSNRESFYQIPPPKI